MSRINPSEILPLRHCSALALSILIANLIVWIVFKTATTFMHVHTNYATILNYVHFDNVNCEIKSNNLYNVL